ncbi:sensor histidine kinase [Microlunatus spumicola]|uniref:histidine kinase n=1 Tax=Microlunatus spumicola TaxID=81499 RepID=A0ABP6X1M2_9ACTN
MQGHRAGVLPRSADRGGPVVASAGWGVRLRAAVDALEQILAGLATGVLALLVLVVVLAVAALCLVGVGLLAVPVTLRLLRAVADRERARLSRPDWPLPPAGAAPATARLAAQDPVVRRELGWLVLHATFGVAVGLLGLTMPLWVVQDVTFPLWYRLVDHAPSVVFARVDGLGDALLVALLGLVFAVAFVVLGPLVARLQGWPGVALLAPLGGDLSRRVAELVSTRAAALDAHAAELRRIERSLHDGSQNRLVAANVLIGAARRAVVRDPAAADALLEKAQAATEQALAELRGVVRSILPPVLDRGLAEAVDGLAAGAPVPCVVEVDLRERCAASVEATAYFAVAEAVTNTRHSGAALVRVDLRTEAGELLLRVADDGHGGADERRGSGLAGIRRRVEAHDGTFRLDSPAFGPTVLEVRLPCGS